jgi:hypothetical protein
MAACVRCKDETQLQDGGDPICLACSFLDETEAKLLKTKENHILKILIRDFVDAKKRKNEADEVFDNATSRIPSGLPHPDGMQQIKNVSSQLSTSQKALMTAHNRLSDFLGRGIVPDDLKQKE